MAQPKTVFRLESRPTLKDIIGAVLAAKDGLDADRRVLMRRLGQSFVMYAQDEAPKRTGDFAEGIRYRTYEQGEVFGMTVSTPQPLGRFIIGGTKPHWIAARRAGALYFFWGKVGAFVTVPKRGGFPTHFGKDGKLWIGKGGVDHPGTKPNPFITRAYKRWQPQAQDGLRMIATNWQKTTVNKRSYSHMVTI